MAETTKIPVDKALEKMRRDDAAQSKRARADQKTEELNEELQRLRAQRARLNNPGGR